MPKDESGSLRKNEDKKDAKDRDYKGQARVGGVEYWISGWKNTDDDGSQWLGLRFKAKDDQKPRRPQQQQRRNDDGDEPF